MDAHPRSVLASGFVALDVVRRDHDVWIRAGGTAGNVAANLAYFGWKARIAGLIGRDDAGRIVSRDLFDAGVDTADLYQHVEVGTPLVLHEVNGKSHRFKFGCSVCGRPYRRYRPLSMTKVSKLLSCERLADVFFFDRPGAATLALAEAHAKAGRLVVYEPSSAGNAGAHMRAAALSDVIKYSEEQATKFERYFSEYPPNHQLRIVTRGDKGVLFRLGPEAWREQPAHRVSVVDAGGAGDWMTAALLDGLGLHRPWQEAEVEEAVRWAQGVAAISCLVPGARLLASILESRVLRQQVKALLSEGAPKVFELELRGIRRTSKRCEACRLPFIASMEGRRRPSHPIMVNPVRLSKPASPIPQEGTA
jgi:sugar/nucleoside kinase (ribokinase family)